MEEGCNRLKEVCINNVADIHIIKFYKKGSEVLCSERLGKYHHSLQSSI